MCGSAPEKAAALLQDLGRGDIGDGRCLLERRFHELRRREPIHAFAQVSRVEPSVRTMPVSTDCTPRRSAILGSPNE